MNGKKKMACIVPICPKCENYDCPGFRGGKCIFEGYVSKKIPAANSYSYDTSGALCDVLSLLEHKYPSVFAQIDKETIEWWKKHEREEQKKIREEALNKLTPREKRALNIK